MKPTPEKPKQEKKTIQDSCQSAVVSANPPNSPALNVGSKRARDESPKKPVPSPSYVKPFPKKSKGISSLSIYKYKKNRTELKQSGYIPSFSEVSTALAKPTKSNSCVTKESTKINTNTSENIIEEHAPENSSLTEVSTETPSSVFHVLDRRINLDSFHKDASFYTLLRSWVQDDPYRQIPPVIKLVYGEHDCAEKVSRTSEKSRKKVPLKVDVLKTIQEMNLRKSQRKKVSIESSQDLLKNVVKKAKILRAEKRKSQNTEFILQSSRLQNTKVEHLLKKYRKTMKLKATC
mmetsp:Transcript_42175/g.98858  ORF Transcript_42175/g.98858 Transcript_42175/m.98858 type:complete len:291 (-) Transcript_42175:222-1094(-)